MAGSGYAKDVMPDRAGSDIAGGTVLPPGTGAGGQQGQVAPSKRQYGKAKYESVTAAEALARMNKRQAGKLPPIAGGLDDPRMGVSRTPASAMKAAETLQAGAIRAITRASDPEAEIEDEFGVGTALGDMDGFSPMPPAGADDIALRPARKAAPARETPVPRPEAKILPYEPMDETARVRTDYLARRRRISMELQDGTMSISVVDVIHSRYGVTILLPQAAESSIFTPKPGSEITLVDGDKQYACYFPGAHFDLPALGLIGLSFIRKDEQNG